ncbi:flagellar hook-basal body complex protein FliE [Lachnospiraceae bacterium YSD2013]|nr:flagellar hook-basal body complex protein FliE [Lachnospiraceae bacterium YSD2013]
MDLKILSNTTAPVRSAQNVEVLKQDSRTDNMFQTILNSAIDNINNTNSLLSDAENEEISFAMGKTENAHDLMIALNKASTALQYTVAVRDKFMEAYKEIMNMQI